MEAIDQLCGYTTWHDTKTSLVIFNKDNKDFGALLDSLNKTVKEMDRGKEISRLGQNEWQGRFTKEKGSNDMLTIHIAVYDLYIKE